MNNIIIGENAYRCPTHCIVNDPGHGCFVGGCEYCYDPINKVCPCRYCEKKRTGIDPGNCPPKPYLVEYYEKRNQIWGIKKLV